MAKPPAMHPISTGFTSTFIGRCKGLLAASVLSLTRSWPRRKRADAPREEIRSPYPVVSSGMAKEAIPETSFVVAKANVVAETSAPPAPPAIAPQAPLTKPKAPRQRSLPVSPKREALRAKLSSLESRVFELEARKAEMDELLADFAAYQYRALGELIGEQLSLREAVLRQRAERSRDAEDVAAAAEAAAEHAHYRRTCDTPTPALPELADDARDELKGLYRAAAMRCHPDRVGDAEKARAHDFFLRTQNAYQARDLEGLRQIIRELTLQHTPSSKKSSATRSIDLERAIQQLGDRAVALMMAIQILQMQPEYRQARNRDRWESDFAQVRRDIEDECAAMRRELR
jgi:hypothetical protein